MGCYNTIIAKCPSCGAENEFQTKGGDCSMSNFPLKETPDDDMLDANRHAPCPCINCGVRLIFEYSVRGAKVIDRRLIVYDSAGDQSPNAVA